MTGLAPISVPHPSAGNRPAPAIRRTPAPAIRVGCAALFLALLIPAGFPASARPDPDSGGRGEPGAYGRGVAAATWSRWARAWDDLDPGEGAAPTLEDAVRIETRRESLTDSLADALARFGLPVQPADNLVRSWVNERLLEAIRQEDPRFLPFLRRMRWDPHLAVWDPAGAWSLPLGVALNAIRERDAALGWLENHPASGADSAFSSALGIEVRLDLGDTLRAGGDAARRLLDTSCPEWEKRFLERVQILRALAEDDTMTARVELAVYDARHPGEYWQRSRLLRLARVRGDAAAVDSLRWRIAREHPSSELAGDLLLREVPARGPVSSSLPPARLRLLLAVAEEQGEFSRFRRIAGALDPVLDPGGRDSLALRGGRLAYWARDYDLLIDEARAGRWNPGPPLAADWALLVARAFRNSDRPDSMEHWFERAAQLGDADQRILARWEWARELESRREFPRAQAVYQRLLDDGAGPRTYSAYFRLGLCQFQEGAYDQARATFTCLLASPDPEDRAAGNYWGYRCALALGLDREARESLERAAAEDAGYYAARARSALRFSDADGGPPVGDVVGYWERLAAISEHPALGEIRLRAEMAPPLRADPDSVLDPDLRRIAARLLLFRQYGHGEWAGESLSELDAQPGMGSGPARIERLHRLGLPDLATRRAVREGRTDPALRYPAPFGMPVAAAAARWSLAPEWIWSVMRRESFFEPAVRSGAGAVGLMQLMSGTAAMVAGVYGLEPLPLRSPRVNVLLGTAHLHDLFEETGGNWPVALAAYNAGMENAKRWTDPADDPDLFIEMIGYRETRDYVKAVIEGFWIYRESLRGPGQGNP
jgi:hypothetical protein